MAAKVMVKSDTHSGIRERVQTALSAKHTPGRADEYYGDPYVQDMFPDKVVHTLPGKEHRGKLFASKYDAGKEGMGLGDPKEVEQAYKPMAESSRGLVSESRAFAEAATLTAPTPKTRELTVTIIKQGFNTSKSRFYSPKALRETGHVFTGAKVFINHATKAEEAARPEGSVHDWAGTFTGAPWLESGTGGLELKSKMTVHHEGAVKMLDALKEANLLHEMGMSIRAGGVSTPAVVQGARTNYVESFVVCKSVDMVTFPGAGGKVDSMAESDGQYYLSASELDEVFQESEANDIDLMPLSVLLEKRPDLVAQITKEAQETYAMAKTVEELEKELKEANDRTAAAESRLVEAESTGKKAAVKLELDTRLKEAALPKVTEDRIRAQFAESVDVSAVAAAITAEQAYLKEAGVTLKKPVTKQGELRESAPADTTAKKLVRDNYVESLARTPGFTKEMAESSANDLGL